MELCRQRSVEKSLQKAFTDAFAKAQTIDGRVVNDCKVVNKKEGRFWILFID